MIPYFENLKTEEAILMFEAVPLITLLIAGADGKIEPKELKEADKFIQIRMYAHPASLREYYEVVSRNYKETLAEMLGSMPADVSARSRWISEKLTGLNAILPRLDRNFSSLLYKSYIQFARYVAESSGGFLGVGAISKEEAKLLDLPMIVNVAWD